MSSVWVIFGLVGALRANLKVAASLSGSEKAGVDLMGAGGFTASRTSNALCFYQVGRSNTPVMWRDTSNQLLSRLEVTSSPWIRPLCIAIGYSRCPWDWVHWRCVQEILIPSLWTLMTMIITTFPAFILMPSPYRLGPVQVVSLTLQLTTGLIVGSIVPILMHRLNSHGLPCLTELDISRYNRDGIIRKGDHVVRSLQKNISHLIWQCPSTEASIRSGDLWLIRILCALNALIILGAYLSNYVALGAVNVTRQYLWLATQILILALRYTIWACRPVWFPQRPPALLYIVAGSLGNALMADVPSARISIDMNPPLLERTVVEFAIAAAFSKNFN